MLLDEPTIGIDIISQKNIRRFLKFYNQNTKTTIILTSHYMNDIEDLCKRAIVINQGEKVYDGELIKINDMFSQRKTIKLQLSETVNKDILSKYGIVKEFNGYNALIEIEKNETKEISNAMFNSLPVIDMNIEDIPIEEGIAMLYKKQGVEKSGVYA